MPDPLTLRSGAKVTTADLWRDQRRAEIAEDFEREVVGRVPQGVPNVTWSVAAGPVFRLLGARDLCKSDDYGLEKMSPVGEGLLDGALDWRP